MVLALLAGNAMFQSSPPRMRGRYQRHQLRRNAVGQFQSSPPRMRGRYLSYQPIRRHKTCFNPRPLA